MKKLSYQGYILGRKHLFEQWLLVLSFREKKLNLSLTDHHLFGTMNFTTRLYMYMRVIFAVINTTQAVVKIRPEKNSGLCQQDLNT